MVVASNKNYYFWLEAPSVGISVSISVRIKKEKENEEQTSAVHFEREKDSLESERPKFRKIIHSQCMVPYT